MELLVSELFQLLTKRNESLAVAESCTGGGLANCITTQPGISSIFYGSVTTYANDAKETLLRIPHNIIASKGAVSEEVALLMASHCRTIFSSTWALSTTGFAGPSGETNDKPLGLVYIGLAGPLVQQVERFVFSPCTRLLHRARTIEAALTMLIRALSKKAA